MNADCLETQFGFLGSDSAPTSGQSIRKRKKGQVFPLAISYGGFFLSEASTLVLADEPMLMMPASSSQAVVTDLTAPGEPTHIEDRSSVGEG